MDVILRSEGFYIIHSKNIRSNLVTMNFVHNLNIITPYCYCSDRHSGFFSDVIKDALDVTMRSEVLNIKYIVNLKY